ncbi:receptor-like protein 7 [Gossypium hirsutum]|uniref:Receptor-like protein 7 n=1 Tax=Gossypium hirsutum TaxID=3635 RepID=A0ABM2ZI67_GOSHI|nr:receptor-like protein 7 [Gossypium hirsutum]
MTAFPTRFDKLENLRYLNLSEAGFTGQIPIEISHLTRLVTLYLSIDTLFRTPLKLEKQNLKTLVQNLTKLRILYLYGVNISAMGNEWCQALSPLTELQVLSMSDLIRLDRNNLSGLIPQFFTKFPNLTCLRLSSVNFSGPIPSFSSSINLRDLILALNQLNGTIHSTDWSGLSKLEIIGLGNNKLSGTIPPTLFGIPSLRTLSLSHNQFNGSIGDFHGKASSLINTLDLGNNMLQGQFPMFVFELHGLTSLNLSSNNFSGLIPVSAFQNLRNLSALGLSYNRWSIDATTINISSLSLPTLAELDLASCNLTEFPGFERPLKNITSSVEILDLHGNQLQGEIPILSNAAYLDYSNNNFNSVLPAQIGDSLQYAFFFSLSNNNIQGSIPESICNSKYLEVLDLSNNSLSGPIPQCLFQMNRSLGVLNLRRNNLSGIISDTSSKSCQLQTLNLNQNRLEGKVPNSLVNCKMVKLLDIGNNHINDSFPSHLKNIATLQQIQRLH